MTPYGQMDGSPSGSCVHGISQTRMLGQVAISFSIEPHFTDGKTWKKFGLSVHRWEAKESPTALSLFNTELGCIIQAGIKFCSPILGIPVSTDKSHSYFLLCYNINFLFVSHVVEIDGERVDVGVTQKHLFTRFFPSTLYN